MKKLYILVISLSIAGFAGAQNNQPSEKRQQDIEALKVAFISRELNLTPEEAQKFWPVYNQYAKELSATIKDDEDVLDRDEKVLNLRKRYRDQFTKILGAERMNQVFNAEGRFRQLLIKSLRNQRNKGNRQMLQRGL
ncbi:MAG: hypothetical protein JWP81_3135 [Ferruginibacter sp.]|nr:hypothetical protein [Ferruginibacter sp.]